MTTLGRRGEEKKKGKKGTYLRYILSLPVPAWAVGVAAGPLIAKSGQAEKPKVAKSGEAENPSVIQDFGGPRQVPFLRGPAPTGTCFFRGRAIHVGANLPGFFFLPRFYSACWEISSIIKRSGGIGTSTGVGSSQR